MGDPPLKKRTPLKGNSSGATQNQNATAPQDYASPVLAQAWAEKPQPTLKRKSSSPPQPTLKCKSKPLSGGDSSNESKAVVPQHKQASQEKYPGPDWHTKPGWIWPDGTPEHRREIEQAITEPINRALAIIKQIKQSGGKISAIIAMSWQARKWADEQRAGDLSANAVLQVYAQHADQTGRTWVGSNTIAEQLETSQPTVLDATKRIIKRGLMKDTKERVGATGNVRVFQLKMPRQKAKQRTRGFSVKHTSNAKATHKQCTSNAQEALALSDTRARGTRNMEHGKETIVQPSAAELIVSSHNKDKDDENVRPGLNRPNDTGEVFEYIYCTDNDETEALERYFNELADDEAEQDIHYWLHMNERRGWRGVTDWHVYLRETFLRGWFPSQQRKASRR
jgi:hypothetical protein